MVERGVVADLCVCVGPDWGNLEWRVFRLVGGKGGEEWRLEGKEMVVDEREVGSLPN